MRPEREREPGRAREGANSELVMPGQLGRLLLEALGAGQRVAMEVGCLALHGSHAALHRTRGVCRGARLGGHVRVDCMLNWAMVLEAKLFLS